MVDAELGPICSSVHCGKTAGGRAGAVVVEMTVQDILAGGLRNCFRRHAGAVRDQKEAVKYMA